MAGAPPAGAHQRRRRRAKALIRAAIAAVLLAERERAAPRAYAASRRVGAVHQAAQRVDERRAPRGAAMSDTLVRVTIDSVVAGGDGIGRTNGMVVFVPRTAPGDEADVSRAAEQAVCARASRVARGGVARAHRAGVRALRGRPVRRMPDPASRLSARSFARSARSSATRSRRIGKRDVENPVVEASDAQWRYRRKLTLHLRRLR